MDRLIREQVTEQLLGETIKQIDEAAEEAKGKARERVKEVVDQIEIKHLEQAHNVMYQRDEIRVLVGWRD